MTNTRKKACFTKNFYEKNAWIVNQVVCGIDEVGRGCLAGPLVTAAVILPKNKAPRILKDSKILTQQEREHAYTWIAKHCTYAIGIVHNRIIDDHNIWHSTLLAMKKAFVHLMAIAPGEPSAILVDAMPLKVEDTGYPHIPVYHFIKGEDRSSSIAAASIVAKVTRDRLMKQLEPLFPGYGIERHKGYATPQHRTAVLELGSTIIHRTNFLKFTLEPSNISDDYERQQTVC